MPETAGLSEVLRRRFAREAQAAAKLSHPNIAAVYDATPDYIAMQLVEGTSVLEVGREPRLLARLHRDAARAVQFAHDHGVVHRDLKPSNLMVEAPPGGDFADARVFVLDFGLAKETSIDSSLSMSGSILGTPAFMPPEQALGRTREVDGRSDLYGLGATLYACLTGAAPFTHTEVLQVLRQVVEDEPRAPGVDPDLDAVVLKCLAKEPERRYQTAAELAADLERWLCGEPVRARPPSVAYRLRKLLARRKPLVAAVAAAAVVSLLLLAFALHQRSSRRAAEQAVGLASRTAIVLTNAEQCLREGQADTARALLDDAIAEWEDFLAQFPVAEGYYFLGRLNRVRERRAPARAALDRALELHPGHVGARFERGLLALAELGSLRAEHLLTPGEASGEHAAAVAALEAQVRADLDVEDDGAVRRVDFLYARAQLARMRGQLDLAERGLAEVIAQDPQHGEARLALVRLYYETGQAAAAAQLAAGMQDFARGFAPVFLSRGQVVEGAADGAAPPPSQLEELALPGLPAQLADPGVARGGETPAARSAQRAVDDARDAVAAAGRGDRAAALAAWERAVAAGDAALQQDPDCAAAYHTRAVAHAEQASLLRALSRVPDAVLADRRARQDLDEAVRRAPRFAPALLERARLRIAQADRLLLVGRGRSAARELDGALADCDEVLGFAPEHAAAAALRAAASGRRRDLGARLDK
jgi:serine/threonine-protein kinase